VIGRGHAAIPHPMLWGAWLDEHYTGGKPPADMTAQTALNTLSGKNASICLWGNSYDVAFDSSGATTIRSAGYLPFFNFGGWTETNAQVAAGALDADFEALAADVAAWGHPIFLRTAWEMNGDWYEWGANNNGNAADGVDYIAMWRRIVGIFDAEGATNATWVWCPESDRVGELPDLRLFYPGDAYVDWVAIDGYRFPAEAYTFTEVFDEAYDRCVEVAPSKPMMICEFGCKDETGGGQTKAQWIAQAFASLPVRFPAVRAVVYYDKEDSACGATCVLNSSAASSGAWSRGVAPHGYKANVYASAATSPIPRPA
jgi:hypothetical protein